MSDLRFEKSGTSRRFVLPALAIALAFISPIAGAVLGIFALKQLANRQTDPSTKRLAKGGMIFLIIFTALYIGTAVLLVATGYDLFP